MVCGGTPELPVGFREDTGRTRLVLGEPRAGGKVWRGCPGAEAAVGSSELGEFLERVMLRRVSVSRGELSSASSGC